jgi:hypothetical protein
MSLIAWLLIGVIVVLVGIAFILNDILKALWAIKNSATHAANIYIRKNTG